MNRVRIAVAAALAGAAFAGSASAAPPNIFAVNCNNSTVSLNGGAPASKPAGTALGVVLGTASAAASFSPAPASGDAIEITGLCSQDVAVTVSGLTITNPNYNASTNPTPALVASDGITGQLEVSGATGTSVSGILLGATASFSFASATDRALLYAHDGAAVTLGNATVEFSPLLGVLAARSSEVAILNATVASNGGNNADTSQRDNGGVQARDNGTVVLGLAGGTMPVTVTGHAFDAVSAYRSSNVVLYAAQLTNNTAHQVNIVSSSSAYITGNDTASPTTPATTILAPSGAQTAVQATGTSTVRIDTLASITGASGTQAVSVNEGSALLLQGSLIAAAGAGPVVLASAGSVLGLAGGNVVCNGSLGGTTCTPATGIALEITRVSSLVQVNAADFGYTAAPENVYGGGAAVLQSTTDLGAGIIGGVPSLTWTNTGGTAVENLSISQNSSFRVEGGVAISGSVALSQSSNGFANLSHNSGNTTPNTVGSLTCPFISIPAAHMSITSTSGGVPELGQTGGGGAITLSTVFNSTAANQCLSF